MKFNPNSISMEAKELMIGDWVMYDPFVECEEQDIIRKPYPTQIKNGEDIDYAIEGGYSPIPLTEEILEKNEFEKNILIPEDSKYEQVWFQYNPKPEYPSDGIWLRYWGKDGFSYDSKIQIKYVHQLQHLLRMAGIDKEIVL